MSSNITTELKPCPFCGENPKHITDEMAIDCECGVYFGKFGSRERLFGHWNQRVAPSVSVETKTEDSQNIRLRDALEKAQAGIIRFLIPWRSHLSKDWIKHLMDVGLVEQDGAGMFAPAKKSILSEHDGNSLAVRASSKDSEPASGKFKMSIFENLLNEAEDAADALIKCHPIGSWEYERGIALQLAIERAAK